MNDMFRFQLDADVEKGSYKGEEKRLIHGYASTEDGDRQNECLIQKGLDINDFVNFGYFNYDHDNRIILGYPHNTCRIDSNGFWVEGELLKGIPEADKMWELALALKKSSAPRKLGFSVEGKILQKSGNRITKAKIYNVAITPNPVNTNCTWDAVVKSFKGQDMIKAMSSGYETNPSDMTGGEVFREESLEDSLHNLSYVIDDDEKKKLLNKKLKQKNNLTKSELTLYLQIAHGLSYNKACEFIKNYV